MRRTTSLTAAGLLALALLGGAPPTTAAGETCRGEPATIVGGGGPITGTEGRDVIVTAGSRRVTALGGDDLICLTGPVVAGEAYVPVALDAGPGDDLVDGTATGDWVAEGVLGPGADTFLGGPGNERVRAGTTTPDYSDHLDTDVDVLVGGGGTDDFVSGQTGQPNADRIDLGEGNDRVSFLGSPAAGATVAGGPGVDGVVVSLLGGPNGVDAAAGTLSLSGTPTVPLAGLEEFFLRKPATATADLTFTGSAASEHVEVWGTRASGQVVADLAGGDDTLVLQRVARRGSRLVGGAGRDQLVATSPGRRVAWDLRGGTLAVGHAWSVPATDFEDATLLAPRVEIRGTGGDNDLAFVSCAGTLIGRGGDDTLVLTGDAYFEEYPACAERTRMVGGRGDDRFYSRAGARDRMVGGRGNDRFDSRGGDDRLFGGPGKDRAKLGNGNDRFVGGPGRDRVDGQRGRDRCVAERERRCER